LCAVIDQLLLRKRNDKDHALLSSVYHGSPLFRRIPAEIARDRIAPYALGHDTDKLRHTLPSDKKVFADHGPVCRLHPSESGPYPKRPPITWQQRIKQSCTLSSHFTS
jgi:hypothetical protein